MKDSPTAQKIRAGLLDCAKAGTSDQAMAALTTHVFGSRTKNGIGIDVAVMALERAGFDPPEDPRWFSARLACNILGVLP